MLNIFKYKGYDACNPGGYSVTLPSLRTLIFVNDAEEACALESSSRDVRPYVERLPVLFWQRRVCPVETNEDRESTFQGGYPPLSTVPVVSVLL